MNFKEQFSIFKNEKPDNLDERELRKKPVPNSGGVMNLGELYEQTKNNNELLPGENFLSFVERMKKTWQGEDEPDKPVKRAA
ncbi:MAG TPA: hypothetical protein VMD74_03225 [Candidatus Methylomirabilis sp.]|nr:hypothetical protein [Candidatus Methylomirabilis sp.]